MFSGTVGLAKEVLGPLLPLPAESLLEETGWSGGWFEVFLPVGRKVIGGHTERLAASVSADGRKLL